MKKQSAKRKVYTVGDHITVRLIGEGADEVVQLINSLERISPGVMKILLDHINERSTPIWAEKMKNELLSGIDELAKNLLSTNLQTQNRRETKFSSDGFVVETFDQDKNGVAESLAFSLMSGWDDEDEL